MEKILAARVLSTIITTGYKTLANRQVTLCIKKKMDKNMILSEDDNIYTIKKYVVFDNTLLYNSLLTNKTYNATVNGYTYSNIVLLYNRLWTGKTDNECIYPNIIKVIEPSTQLHSFTPELL